jgi:hypothetical protein
VASVEESRLALVVAAIEGAREPGREGRLRGHGRPAEVEERRVVDVLEDLDLRELQPARAERSLQRVEPGLQREGDPAQRQHEQTAETRGDGEAVAAGAHTGRRLTPAPVEEERQRGREEGRGPAQPLEHGERVGRSE